MIRNATFNDLEKLKDIYAHARIFMSSTGNPLIRISCIIHILLCYVIYFSNSNYITHICFFYKHLLHLPFLKYYTIYEVTI